MQFSNEFEVIRTLNNPALKIFLTLLFARVHNLVIAGEAMMRTYTGLTQNTVRDGVKELSFFGLAHKNPGRNGAYVLSSEAVQLPLVAVMLGGGVDNAVGFANRALPVDEVKNKSQNLTLSSGATTTSYLHSRNRRLEEAEEKLESKFDSKRVKRNLAALHEVGIMGTVAERIAQLDYVTEKYIAYHDQAVRKRPKGSTGLLIRVLMDGDPLPVHDRYCACELCSGRSYDDDGFEIFGDETGE